jgi:hypothetical protein
MAAASGETTTTSSGLACWSVTRTVISFVMLAIGTRSCSWLAYSTSPVIPSWT